jgi:hypothetical protein
MEVWERLASMWGPQHPEQPAATDRNLRRLQKEANKIEEIFS